MNASSSAAACLLASSSAAAASLPLLPLPASSLPSLFLPVVSPSLRPFPAFLLHSSLPLLPSSLPLLAPGFCSPLQHSTGSGPSSLRSIQLACLPTLPLSASSFLHFQLPPFLLPFPSVLR